ncbi:MAG TPA: hypothetical protein PK014_08670 [Thermoanaerobaculia bacterium]|nr:hypothetical protein [Thermoanaerobaculia bacterium]HUM30251.1 hypothetical protein [Thermoanaerobaculia bacterium]HXK68453.1 hypothetical protein [Thermoanaerobaculia bacterium]
MNRGVSYLILITWIVIVSAGSLQCADQRMAAELDLDLLRTLPRGIVDITAIRDVPLILERHEGEQPLIILFGGQDPDPSHPSTDYDLYGLADLDLAGGEALSEDDTRKVVEEIEKFRRRLPRDTVIILEGGEGPTLGSAYQSAYPDQVAGVVTAAGDRSGPERRSSSGTVSVQGGAQLSVEKWIESISGEIFGIHPALPSGDGTKSRPEKERDDNTVKKAAIQMMTAIAVLFGL